MVLNTVRRLAALFALVLMTALPSMAQDGNGRPESLTVFLDCEHSCDFDYIRRTIPYVDWVRDREEADVHMLVTSQTTGSGGRNYEVQFIGLKALDALQDVHVFLSGSINTDAERREGLTATMAAGLVRFLLTTEMGRNLQVSVPVLAQSQAPDLQQGPIVDPWDYWVFNIRMNGDVEGEENEKQYSVETRVSADRVTEEWKLGLSGRFNYRENRFDLSSGTVRSTRRDGNVYGQVVKSVSERWSAGFTTYNTTSSSNNTDLSVSLSPTVEYAFFPYSQTSTRDFRARYEVNFRHNRYDELTVYNETEQTLVQNQFMLFTNFRQPWGSAGARLSMESYVTDFEESLFDLYNVSLRGNLDVRIARGLSVSFDAEVSSVHDQIWLPQQESNDEEILLGNKALPTSFDYEVGFGFSYRFGSIYNNVVNPRLGWGG
ncbi:MAG: hypothetical protein O3C45_04910 [Bacteroidetes bacterium]|nr:hypothetical protein [Bacteroidota bacterium]